MAINKNHEFDDLDGIKCAIVEKNVTAERISFLKNLLEFNGYEVIVIKSPPPKTVVPKVAGQEPVVSPEITQPETFTIGVTDVSFNAVNAVFGRLLRTKGGKIVTLQYWQQTDKEAHDDVPYFSSS